MFPLKDVPHRTYCFKTWFLSVFFLIFTSPRSFFSGFFKRSIFLHISLLIMLFKNVYNRWKWNFLCEHLLDFPVKQLFSDVTFTFSVCLASVGAEAIPKAIQKTSRNKKLFCLASLVIICAVLLPAAMDLAWIYILTYIRTVYWLIPTIESLFTNLPKYALVALPSIIHFKKKLGFLIKLLSEQ